MESPSPRPRLPEGFDKLLGDRSYVTPVPWEWHDGAELVLLRPRRRLHPMQWITGLLLVPGFSFAIHWFVADSQNALPPVALTVICILIPILVMAGFLGLHWWQQKRGPWIEFDCASRTLRLPRVPIELSADEVHLVQVISGILSPGGSNPSRVHEVNAVVLGGEGEAGRRSATRYPVVGTLDGAASRDVARRLKELLGKIEERDSASPSS